MSEIKYIVDNLLSIESFNKLLDQYAEVIEDIRKEKSIHSIVGVVIKHMDDSELKEKFNDMLCRHDEINEKFGHGIEGMMIDPANPEHAALYEDYKKALDHYLIYERPSMELEILKLAYKKLKDNPSVLKGFDGEPLPITQPIELLNAITPKTYIMPNNKLINVMADEVPYNEEFELIVNQKRQIKNRIQLNYDDKNIQIKDKDKRFTVYDRLVYNAVCSIFEAGNTNFSTDQVYRRMYGLNNKEKVSPQARGAITKSIDKMRMELYAIINYTNEAKAYGMELKEDETLKLENFILLADKVTLSAGGREITGYKIYSKPLLYKYAQITKQVITVPNDLLDIKGDIKRITSELVIIRDYLIRRIEIMKRSKEKKGADPVSNKITLEGIYEEIRQPNPTAKKIQTIRDNVDKILAKFKGKKYIKDYDIYKKNGSRAITGFEIIY